jgi:CubicO group peptidase (beta-lactamase class C family)
MAKSWLQTLVYLVLHSTLLLAVCPPLGPILPAPTAPSQDATFQALLTKIDAVFLNLTSALNQTAVSVGVKSIHEDTPFLDLHYTPPKFNVSGVHKVDGNTVYRVGSLTKVFTALGVLQLATEGKINLADPVTKYVPRLGALSGSNTSMTSVDWNTVTVEALMSHMGGVPVDRMLTDDARHPDQKLT